MLAISEDELPIHQNVLDSHGVLMGVLERGAVRNGCGVESNHVGKRTWLQDAATRATESLGRHACHLVNGGLEWHRTSIPTVVTEHAREGAEVPWMRRAFCQRPLKFGADFVVHSLSKNICGFGTDLGGVVIGPKWYENLLMGYRKDFGGALSPKGAWAILVYGLPTLGLRVRRQQATALRIARFLEASDKVRKVNYPGLESFPHYEAARRQMVDPYGEFAPGIMIYFELEGTLAERQERCRALLNHLADHAYTLTLAVSLGQIRTLIENPGSMTHAQMSEKDLEESGIDPYGIRMSVGLEDPDDLCRDLEYSLSALK